ncbi:unnamed protein product [Rhizophagus irregularis]|nr:unnamed protein product [Rhizophagus irregularis]
MPHDKVSNQIYKYRGIIKDIAIRYRCSFALTDKIATQMARAIQKIYDDPNNPLSYPNTFIVDRAIAERDHQEFEKYAYFWQDTEDFHLPLTDRSRV